MVILHEVEDRDVYLSANEADELAAPGLCVQRIVPAAAQDVGQRCLYRVNGNHQVGFFRLSSGRLVQIEAKVPLANVFALLAVAYRFYASSPPFLESTVPYLETRGRPLQALIEHFVGLVEKLLRDGLLRRYVEREDNLHAVRGKLMFEDQIRQNLVYGNRLYCRFTTSEVDNNENRIVLWTLILLQRSHAWPERVRQSLQKQILHFGGVTIVPIHRKQMPEFTYDRLSNRYREVHAWCRFFIDQMMLQSKNGSVEFYGFRINMFQLFERFVFCTFQEAARRTSGIRIEKTAFPFDKGNKIRIVPDILIKARSFVAVGDAKYKLTSGATGRHPDLYQVVAYSIALGLTKGKHRPQGLLIYPASEWTPELSDEVQVLTSPDGQSDLTIRTLWFDLDSEAVFEKALIIVRSALADASA
jgi:5-methylcytosine-specific restriction enzyme subunit McrC